MQSDELPGTGGAFAVSPSPVRDVPSGCLWSAQSAEVASMRRFGAIVMVALSITLLVFWRTAAAMVHTWTNDRSYSQGFIVLPLAIFLAWTRRRKVLCERPQPVVAGLLLLAGLALAWVVGNVGDVLLIQEFALVAIFGAVVWTIAGTAITRQLMFPLGFLFFAVPFGSELLPVLQNFTASFAAAALQFSGVPLVLENHMISVPSGSWQVAEACSGLRFLTASIMIGVLLAGVVYRTWKRRIAFVVLSIVVPIIANGVRAYGIVMLGYWSDNRIAAGVDHVVYGTVFFMLISIALVAFGIRWRDSEKPLAVMPADSKKSNVASTAPVTLARAVAVALAGVLILGVAPLMAARFWARPSPNSTLHVSVNPEWRYSSSYDWDWAPELGSVSAETMKSYLGPHAAALQVYVGNYRDAQRSVVVVNSYNIVRDASRWIVLNEQSRETVVQDRQVRINQMTLQSPSESRLVWLWYVIGDQVTSSPLELKMLEAKYRMLGRPQPAAVVAVSVSYQSDTTQAQATLEKFLSGTSFSRLSVAHDGQ